MASLLFYPGLGRAVLTLAELKSFIIKYWFLGCAGWSFLLSLYIDWRTYFKSFFSKFSSSILKSSELMIFEGCSDIISTAFLLQTVFKICHSSFCTFVSCIWSNSPLRIILIDSSVNTLAEQDFMVNLHLISPFFLMKAWWDFWSSTTMTGFPLSDSIFLNGISDLFTCWKLSYYWTIYLLVRTLKFEKCSLGQLNFIRKG